MPIVTIDPEAGEIQNIIIKRSDTDYRIARYVPMYKIGDYIGDRLPPDSWTAHADGSVTVNRPDEAKVIIRTMVVTQREY